MQWLFLAVLAAAMILWRLPAVSRRRRQPVRPREEEDGSFARWLESPGGLEELTRALRALEELMAHPELGGPGFLSVRLPQPDGDGWVAVAAQYPNIQETLYRCAARQEPEVLAAAGVSRKLLALSPVFETESGGMVAVSIRAAVMGREVAEGISGRRERQAALELLARQLAKRFPGFEARSFGSELLLTPVRREAPPGKSGESAETTPVR